MFITGHRSMISRLLEIIGLFCRILPLLWGSFAKVTDNFKEPTNGRHPIWHAISLMIDEENVIHQEMNGTHYQWIHIINEDTLSMNIHYHWIHSINEYYTVSMNITQYHWLLTCHNHQWTWHKIDEHDTSSLNITHEEMNMTHHQWTWHIRKWTWHIIKWTSHMKKWTSHMKKWRWHIKKWRCHVIKCASHIITQE